MAGFFWAFFLTPAKDELFGEKTHLRRSGDYFPMEESGMASMVECILWERYIWICILWKKLWDGLDALFFFH